MIDKVSFMNLSLQYKDHTDKVMLGLHDLLSTASFVAGKPLEDFESSCKSYFDIDNAVGVGSGTDALILALKSLGVGPGHSVLVPANTFIATAFAVSHVGAEVIFVDVDENTHNIDLNKAESVIESNTICIIPVHLYGQSCNMDDVVAFSERHSLLLVEDCAQAIGSTFKGKKVGTFGEAGCYSFYPAKNLGGLGQGGLVLTPEKEIATTIRELGNVGRKIDSHFDFTHVGYNSRLDTLNAYFLNYFLNLIDEWNLRRQDNALLYYDRLDGFSNGFKLPNILPDCSHVFHLFELKCPDMLTRDVLKKYLNDRGVSTGLHYPIPCNRQPIYSLLNQACPVAENLSGRLLSLPMHPFLTEDEIEYVCNLIKMFVL